MLLLHLCILVSPLFMFFVFVPCFVIQYLVSFLVISSLFVCFVALRPKSTAMVIAGRSVHLTTLFPGQA